MRTICAWILVLHSIYNDTSVHFNLAVANVKPAQGSEPLQQFVPDFVTETRQPVIPSKPVSTMSKDDSESVYTRSTDSSSEYRVMSISIWYQWLV